MVKDILFTLKLYPTFIEKKDYLSIRTQLRSEPAVELRMTCKKLKPFLSIDKQSKFEESYRAMIDAVDDLDSIVLRRIQAEKYSNKKPLSARWEEQDKPDTEVLDSLNKCIDKFEIMLKIVS